MCSFVALWRMSLRWPGERDKRSRFRGHSRVRLWADITRQTQCWR